MPYLSFPSSSSSRYIFHFTIEWKNISQSATLKFDSLFFSRTVTWPLFHFVNSTSSSSTYTTHKKRLLLLLLKFFSTFLPLLSVPLYILSSSIQFVNVRIAADLESRIMTRSPRQQRDITASQPAKKKKKRHHTDTHTTCCPLLHVREVERRKTDGQE